MAWRRPGDKPLSEPMVVALHICVVRPQWVKCRCDVLWFTGSLRSNEESGSLFCLLFGVSSGCARPITGQVTSQWFPWEIPSTDIIKGSLGDSIKWKRLADSLTCAVTQINIRRVMFTKQFKREYKCTFEWHLFDVMVEIQHRVTQEIGKCPMS